MHIVLGATGHVGSFTAATLLEQGEPVTIVTRDAGKGDAWRARGAEVALTDVRDTDALRRVFCGGTRAFLLNPPAAPSTDTDAEERRTAASIVAALEGSGLERVVAESTYGAQPGDRCGDLSILHEFEEALRAQPIPVSVIRAAYYMSNWDAMLRPAREEGLVTTMFPADLRIPMVAPEDLGRVAARLLSAQDDDAGIHYVEGPERCSSADVAAAFARALDRRVELAVVPRDRWEATYRGLAFSEEAARSYARMTAATVDGNFDMPDDPTHGTVTLERYVAGLVEAGSRVKP